MTAIEFHQIINRLTLNSATTPSDAQLDVRLPEIWDEVQGMSPERFERGVKWLVHQPDFKFFPTVGEILEAIRRADREAGEMTFHSNMSEEEFRLTYDPAYRREQRKIADEAARQFFESEEHQRLLYIISQAPPEASVVPLPVPPTEEELALLRKPKQSSFVRCATCHGSGRNGESYCICEHGKALGGFTYSG